MKLFLVFLFSFVLLSLQKRTLVILDNDGIKTTHSQFFTLLQDRGHQLTFQTRGTKVILENYGEYLYDNLIVMSPKADSKWNFFLI